MPLMKFDDIIKDLKNKVYHPVYFLMGEETYSIDVIADFIEDNVLDEAEKEFNFTMLYGKDVDMQTVISHAKRYPMMANHHVVIVKEAQNMNKIDELGSYLDNPQKSTILVILYKYKTVDKRTNFAKKLQKGGVLFESKKLYDNEIPKWITDYVKKQGYSIDPRAVQMLAEYLGADIGKIVNEVGKLFINTPKGSEITLKHIEENIGISKDYNVFELQKALGQKNSFKAFQIVKYFEDNPKSNPNAMILALLFSYFSKILIYHSLKDKSSKNVAAALSVNPFFVNDYITAAKKYPSAKVIDIISLIREYDLKSKGVGNINVSDGQLLKELIYKILN
ncbi:MAG: DNA polymerase III subunit delta [Bacteroidota bacterium]